MFDTTAGGVSTYRNIEYTRAAGVPLHLDAAVPSGEGPFPAVIIVHGGGWVRGDRREDVQPLFDPLSDAGFVWFSISYRLTTNPMQFGTAVEDVQAAIRYVKAHAAEYHVDPQRIALVGESAGGQLAATAAVSGPADVRVRAVVAFYTPMDLVSLARNSEHTPRWVSDNLRGGPLAWLITRRLKRLSPIEYVRRDMPPFLLIHDPNDPLVPFAQSEVMLDRMHAAGAQCELYAVPGVGHGIRWWSPELSAGYKQEMVRWLRGKIGDQAAVRR